MRSIAQKMGVLLLMAVFTTTLSAQTEPLPTQGQTQQIEVTDAELEKFAQAFQEMRMLNQQAQQKMAQVVEEEGLDIQRFNEIHQATVDPAKEADVTEEEQKQYQDITSELQGMQESFQQQMQEIITEQDLTLQEYEQIATQLQNDPELQERLKAVFEN